MLKSEFKIINAFLFRPFDQLYGREIERLTSITHSRAVAYLASLVEAKILISERRGNQVIYSVNPHNELTMKALSIAELERKTDFFNNKLVEKSILYRLVSESLNQCPNLLYFVLLFGSFARGQSRESSDLDILFVTAKNGNTKKKIEEIGKKLEASTGRKISVHVVGLKEIEKRWSNEPIYKGIWDDRIILYGEDQFWNFILNRGGYK